MRLEKIKATPQPEGNRVDLFWVNPEPENYPGVRVVRREKTHPVRPDDGDLVIEGSGITSVEDKDLKGETVYYYTLFPYKNDPPEYQFDRHNRVSTLVTSPYNMAGQMYDLLPRIYHRYDTSLSGNVPEKDKTKGQLRRFLDLPGGQLDRLHSLARAVPDLYNLDKVNGALLPMLAQWIGWDTDYRREIEDQRKEIKNAPAIYKRIGLIPTVEATIKRIVGWENRTKEFVHNVFLSNSPERLNIWASQRNSTGEWSEPTKPLSLDFAYEGRPATVRDGNGTTWLFYHTLRNDRWDIWYKKFMFIINLETEDDLDSDTISPVLKKAFKEEGFSLSGNATIEKQGGSWLITDSENKQTFTVRKETGRLHVHNWTPSRPLTNKDMINKYPSSVLYGSSLWVFRSVYNEETAAWRIKHLVQNGDAWNESNSLPFGDDGIERKKPFAVTDDAGGLWFFWLEKKVGLRWQMKYNRNNGTSWQLDPSGDFPMNGDAMEDFFVFFNSTDASRPIYLFYARKEPGHTYWTIAYRVKQSLDPAISDWSSVQTMPKNSSDTNYHDREPSAFLSNGSIELYWSSNRDGSWSIWRNTLNIATDTWETEEQVTNTPYSQRDPLPLLINDVATLIYHSNESLSYTSEVFGATGTVDSRYAGCTTVHTRNISKIALKGKFEDFQTYTYDVGKKEEDWYARNAVGIYLTPDTENPEIIQSNKKLAEKVLKKFLPIQERTVFIIEPAKHKEFIYTYDFPDKEPQRRITEQFSDELRTATDELYSGLYDSYEDEAPSWIWTRSWSEAYPGHRTVNFSAAPVDTKFRTWHIGVSEGG